MLSSKSPLGKGYLVARFSEEIDYKKVKFGGPWRYGKQMLRLTDWSPNFNVEKQKHSNALIWVKFPGLSLEYWELDILMAMARTVGTPVNVDRNTLKRDNGFYAAVLVDVDLSKPCPSSILVEVEDKTIEFWQEITLGALPEFCSNCQVVGHLTAGCRFLSPLPPEKRVDKKKENFAKVVINGKQTTKRKRKRNKSDPKPSDVVIIDPETEKEGGETSHTKNNDECPKVAEIEAPEAFPSANVEPDHGFVSTFEIVDSATMMNNVQGIEAIPEGPSQIDGLIEEVPNELIVQQNLVDEKIVQHENQEDILEAPQDQVIKPTQEANALNSIFQKWRISAPTDLWNITGEPCSGLAIDDSSFASNPDNNPGIKCDCSYNNATTCHVIQLQVFELSVRGTIPEELTNLTFLTSLNLARNYLTGPLPAFLGNLSRMQYLSLSINALSGTIPEELGRLQDLRSFAFSSNRFSGTLPSQLGSLVNLNQIYMDSSGVGGELPATFKNLVNMQILWASDNPFTGTIPAFIGNWTQLTSLRCQGNSLEGPIPSIFSRLTSLTDLRISDLSNVSSSLAFVRNLKNLTVLVLRNNLLSGNIPSSIAEIPLQRLDLSFNNLSGQIPDSIFNMSSLSFLFLGNNSLSGPVPPQKISSILTVDLSYNRLSGRLPSWATQRNLELNVVANNLTFGASDNIFLNSGLNCLQASFPCSRGSPRYSSFAINCGGPQRSSTDGTIFEAENSTANPASYNVTVGRRWGVSNIGLFGDNSGSAYTVTTQQQITGALDSDLFQTARLSPGSLRYFGLGLENGQYKVNLQFAETSFTDEALRTWDSLGTRIFDIYLQGTLRVKDFNVRREAGGAVHKAVLRDFTVQVSENFLEIHLFWAGKGTCCIPRHGYYGPIISAIKVTPDFEPTVDNLPPTKSSKNYTATIVGITVPILLASTICLFVVFYLRRKKSSTEAEDEFLGMENRPNTFSYAELRSATEEFSPTNKLGEGGFGAVYQGVLTDGRAIAVKKLLLTSHQGKNQFLAEISIISAVQHRNLVKLYGCCIEGSNRLLVYEHLKNKSLDQALFGSNALDLDWDTRYNICLGTARGLAYLHEESTPRIVHRDVKASNILLDLNLNPKISDFGLAKLYDEKHTHISTRVAGTIGYLAPEYAMRGHLTEKADVFGFGVVALEILCGRPNTDSSLDPEKIYLLELAWTLYESDRGVELVDPRLTKFNQEEAIRMLGVALLCTQASPMMRPPMSRVVAMLTGDTDVSSVTQKPSYLTDWQVNENSGFASEDGTTGSSTSRTRTTQPFSNSSVSMEADAGQSPLPMLHSMGSIGR